VRILHLTAGTGSFYCGTCIRDNALARGLGRLGHEVDLVPLYMPIVAEGEACSAHQPILMGGINCYLQQEVPLFRALPMWMDQALSARPLLQLASGQAGKTRPEDTGPMTVSMLRGSGGHQAKEVARLVAWVQQQAVGPEVIVLSNSLLVGLARPLRDALGVPVVCTVQGELHFVDALGEPWTGQAWPLLAEGLADCDGLIAVSGFVADVMAARTGIPRERFEVVHNGIDLEGYAGGGSSDGPAVLGFLARMYGRKGLDELARIFIALRGQGREVLLDVAGTLNAGDERDVVVFRQTLEAAGVLEHVRWHPNLSPADKRALFKTFTVFCVPSAKDETFGLYHLEALASEVPVVAMARGAVPEVLERTGGAVLVPAGDVEAAVAAIGALLDDPDRRRALGMEGRRGVETGFTEAHMAAQEAGVLAQVAATFRARQAPGTEAGA
jgi:glycosyltransferase involved in cell wall biosynthesis